MSHWKQQKEVGGSFGIWVLFFIFKLFGANICKIFTSPVLLYFYIFNKKGRVAINEFYANLSTITNKNYKQNNTIKNFFFFGFGVVDRLAIWCNKIPKSKVNPINESSIYDYIDKKIGGIIMTSHLGNFELSRVASKSRTSAVMNIIVDLSNAKKMQKIMQATSNEYNLNIITVESINMATVMMLQEKIEAGEFLVIAGDRTPKDNKNTVKANFLGKQANFPTGAYILAKILGCPTFSIVCLKNKDKYDVYFDLLFKKINFNSKNKQEILSLCATKYANKLEKYTQIAPEQWYNFYDFWRK